MTAPSDVNDPIDPFQPAPEGSQWVVLHARPRCEKKIEVLRRQREAHIYLPCIERVHTYGARVRKYMVPLFPGYVFALIRREDRMWFRQNASVANVIEVCDEAKFLQTLRAVALALQEDVNLEVLPFLEAGRKVRIIGGPMKGLEAVIVEIKGRSRVILQLELIQQSVALEIDAAYLKAAD